MIPPSRRLWRRQCKYEFHVPLTANFGYRKVGRESTAHCVIYISVILRDLQGNTTVPHESLHFRLLFRTGSDFSGPSVCMIGLRIIHQGTHMGALISMGEIAPTSPARPVLMMSPSWATQEEVGEDDEDPECAKNRLRLPSVSE
jgi:hypothetical protein